MTLEKPTQLPGDKLKKAITFFSELQQKKPEKSRKQLLLEVELQFDRSPLECEFLNKHLAGQDFKADGET